MIEGVQVLNMVENHIRTTFGRLVEDSFETLVEPVLNASKNLVDSDVDAFKALRQGHVATALQNLVLGNWKSMCRNR